MLLSPSRSAHAPLAGVAFERRAASKKPLSSGDSELDAASTASVLFGIHVSFPKTHVDWTSGLAAIFAHCSASSAFLDLAAMPQSDPPSITGCVSPDLPGSGKLPRSSSVSAGFAFLIMSM
ncbi:hypothetical protein BFL35_03225 [Clavibacter michiganensis]|nr:hypothetical protein BFL35_03225 [Clavibacter michiganensis]